MPVPRPEITDPLRYREDEHHRDDGHWSESLEGEWHKIVFVGCARNLRPIPTLLDPNSITNLDKVRLNLFHSYPHINIFPQNPVNHFGDG